MSLNPSKGNMYNFVTHTWNTIKGACPHGCAYCYMRRFGEQKPMRFDSKELKTDLGEGNFIFVGSSCDLFAIDIPADWILETLRKCYDASNNKYLFQSKNPGGFLAINRVGYGFRPTLCTTIETNRLYPEIIGATPSPRDRADAMNNFDCYRRFVTIEPIMDFDLSPLVELVKRCEPEQVNIGADSGNNHLPEPSAEKVLALIEELGKFTVLARKTNLSRLLK
jgi:hypothetical protein